VDWWRPQIDAALDVLDRADDPRVQAAARLRETEYRGTPLNVYRHVLLSGTATHARCPRRA